jgi:hypothetical protein
MIVTREKGRLTAAAIVKQGYEATETALQESHRQMEYGEKRVS